MTKIAIIDGDVLAYNACKPRWQSKYKIENETQFVSLDDNGKKLAPEFTQEEDRYYLEESWENFKTNLDKLVSKLFCDDYVMAVAGENNFRKLMYPEYKMNRHADPTKQNHFVPVLRQLAAAEDLAIRAHGREADDLICTWAFEARAANIDYIVCSIDKDLLCIPGKHWRIHKEELVEISELEALKHYYMQLLVGDTTDNIPGVPKVGPKTAEKAFLGVETEQELQEIVVSHYIAAYDEFWREMLLSNGKMIHIQRNPNDYFTLENWPIVKELTNQ